LTVEGSSYTGLFGYVNASAAVVKGVTVDGAYVKGSGTLAGAVVGRVHAGRITNCRALNSYVSGVDRVGGVVGLAGINSATAVAIVDNCLAVDTVVVGSGTYGAGGVVGCLDDNSSKLRGCAAIGTKPGRMSVTYTGSDYGVGGVVGAISRNYSTANIENCYSNAEVYGGSGKGVGGVLGWDNDGSNTTTQINCYFAGTITKGSASYAGGVYGSRIASNNTTTNCYYDADVIRGVSWGFRSTLM
jgi:hypothetical protein